MQLSKSDRVVRGSAGRREACRSCPRIFNNETGEGRGGEFPLGGGVVGGQSTAVEGGRRGGLPAPGPATSSPLPRDRLAVLQH